MILKYHIDGCVEDPVSSHITLFHRSPYRHLRNRSWDLLNRLANMSNKPWLVFGDFNEVFFSWEVMGAR